MTPLDYAIFALYMLGVLAVGTSGQILAGAKLMSGSVIDAAPWGMDVQTFAILLIGVVIVGYTAQPSPFSNQCCA